MSLFAAFIAITVALVVGFVGGIIATRKNAAHLERVLLAVTGSRERMQDAIRDFDRSVAEARAMLKKGVKGD